MTTLEGPPDELRRDRTDFRQSVRAFLSAHGGTTVPAFGVARDVAAVVSLWRHASAELGLAGLGVPESLGGLGATPIFGAIAREETGRVVSPLPLTSTALAVSILLRAGDRASQETWLPRIATGRTIAVAALHERPHDGGGTHVGTRGREHVDGTWRLTGVKPWVVDLDLADVVLVSADTGAGAAIFAVEPNAVGVTREDLRGLDPTRGVGRLRLDGAPAALVGSVDPEALGAALREGAFALAAEQLGVAAGALDMAVGYAGSRVQFGRPIGSFQALKHLLADRYVEVESLRAAVEQTALALGDADAEDSALLMHLCQVVGSETALSVTGAAVQVHGGIGFTWEHEVHLYFKRATVDRQWLGTPDHHREHIARMTLDANENQE